MRPAEDTQYFEAAAMSNKAIGHVPGDPNNKRFFRWSIEELENDITSKFKGISLIVERSGFRDVDELSDNPFLQHSKAFWILAPIKDRENFALTEQLEDECYEVALQMYSKLRNDHRAGIYKGFVPGTFTGTPFLNLDSTAVGYRCSFLYKAPAPTQLNVEDWNSETLSE